MFCVFHSIYTYRCAMALLHSRVRRVFYARQNRLIGGLGSCFKIHTLHELNHHFEVFMVSCKGT